jgi:putative ABC transport system substrate-binding protein
MLRCALAREAQMTAVARRKLLAAFGGAAAWPLAARGQQSERIPRVGVLLGFDDPSLTAFWQELEKLGWSDGRTVHIERRYAPAGADVRRSPKSW